MEYLFDAVNDFVHRRISITSAGRNPFKAEGAVFGEHRREQIPLLCVDESKVACLQLFDFLQRNEAIHLTSFRQGGPPLAGS
jgi:hypothetical protein